MKRSHTNRSHHHYLSSISQSVSPSVRPAPTDRLISVDLGLEFPSKWPEEENTARNLSKTSHSIRRTDTDSRNSQQQKQQANESNVKENGNVLNIYRHLIIWKRTRDQQDQTRHHHHLYRLISISEYEIPMPPNGRTDWDSEVGGVLLLLMYKHITTRSYTRSYMDQLETIQRGPSGSEGSRKSGVNIVKANKCIDSE